MRNRQVEQRLDPRVVGGAQDEVASRPRQTVEARCRPPPARQVPAGRRVGSRGPVRCARGTAGPGSRGAAASRPRLVAVEREELREVFSSLRLGPRTGHRHRSAADRSGRRRAVRRSPRGSPLPPRPARSPRDPGDDPVEPRLPAAAARAAERNRARPAPTGTATAAWPPDGANSTTPAAAAAERAVRRVSSMSSITSGVTRSRAGRYAPKGTIGSWAGSRRPLGWDHGHRSTSARRSHAP